MLYHQHPNYLSYYPIHHAFYLHYFTSNLPKHSHFGQFGHPARLPEFLYIIMGDHHKGSCLSGDPATAMWLKTERPLHPNHPKGTSSLPLVRHTYWPLSGGDSEMIDWEIENPPLRSSADVQIYVQSCISKNPKLFGVKRVVKTITYDEKKESLHWREVLAMVMFNGGTDSVSLPGFLPSSPYEFPC